MPRQITPEARLSATSPACRAIVATRLMSPELEHAAFRALQSARFTTTGTLDDSDTLVPRLRALTAWTRALSIRHDDPRSSLSLGRPCSFTNGSGIRNKVPGQGSEHRRYGTLHSTVAGLQWVDDGQQLETHHFGPIKAYDVGIARNLDPALRAPATSRGVRWKLSGEAFPYAPTNRPRPPPADRSPSASVSPTLPGIEAALRRRHQ